MKPCYVVNYEHAGTVLWGDETLRKLTQTMEDRLQKYPGVKYGWDSDAHTYDDLAANYPDLLAFLKDQMARYPGRIAAGSCTYGQPLSCYISGESNVRQLIEGIRANLTHLGVRPWIYIMSEHAMHAQIPQLIAQAGFRGAVMRNGFCMNGINPEYPASCILWRGLDGQAAIPTVPSYPGEQCSCAVNGYTVDQRTKEFTQFGANPMDTKIIMDYPRDAPWGGLEEFRDRFGGRIKNLIAVRADDPRQQEAFVAEYSGTPEYPWVLDEEILAAAGDPELDVQTQINDFRVRMPWGICGNWIWERCREYESRLFTLDLLDALRAADGLETYPEDLRNVWKMLLITQHHDIQYCGLQEDGRKFFARGDKLLAGLDQALLGSTPTHVFNPLPWTRWDTGLAALSTAPLERPAPTACTLEGTTLRTPWYTAELSETGGFRALRTSTGENVFRPGRISGILAGVINGVPSVAEGSWSFRPGEGSAELTETGTLSGIPYSVTWTFHDRHPRVDCAVDFTLNREFVGRKLSDPNDSLSAYIHEEKLRLKFYPDLPASAMGWRDHPFGVAASNRQYLECNHWGAVQHEDRGFAIFNHGAQCICRELDGALSVPLAFSMYNFWGRSLLLDEQGNEIWCRDEILDNSGQMIEFGFEPGSDLLYQDEDIRKQQKGLPHRTLINEHFLQGEYRNHLAFLPFHGDWASAQLHRRALEYTCQPTPVGPETAELIRKLDLQLELPENLFLSSLYAKDGQLYLRLYEMEGKSGEAVVRLGGAQTRLQPVDFFENPTGEPMDTANLQAWQVRTYQILR